MHPSTNTTVIMIISSLFLVTAMFFIWANILKYYKRNAVSRQYEVWNLWKIALKIKFNPFCCSTCPKNFYKHFTYTMKIFVNEKNARILSLLSSGFTFGIMRKWIYIRTFIPIMCQIIIQEFILFFCPLSALSWLSIGACVREF